LLQTLVVKHSTSSGKGPADADARAVLIRVVLLLGIFPYLSPVRLPIDTSPFYPIAAALLVWLAIIRGDLLLPSSLWTLVACWLFLATATVVKVILLGDSSSLRFAVGFVSQALLVLAVGAAFSGPGGLKRLRDTTSFFSSIIFWGACLWFGAALLQLCSRFIGSPIGFAITDMLVTATRTTEGRGITALAAEPSFAGITCSVLAATCWILKLNDFMSSTRARVAIAGYVAVVLLTASLTSYIALGIFGFFAARRLTSWIVLAMISIGAVMFLPWDALQQLRIVQLARTIMSTPILILADVSTASRVADIVSRFLAVTLDHGLWGHLAEQQTYTVQEIALQSMHTAATPFLLRALEQSGPDAKAMSSLGQLAMDFGLFGLAVYAYNIVVFRLSTSAKGLHGIPVLLALGTFGYLVQLPFTYPTVTTILMLLCSVALNGGRVRLIFPTNSICYS
jgi:hypothetical protein